MDPLETLRLLRGAIRDRDWSEAVIHLNNYYQWRVKGGFEPVVRWESNVSRGDAYASMLADGTADALDEAS